MDKGPVARDGPAARTPETPTNAAGPPLIDVEEDAAFNPARIQTRIGKLGRSYYLS
jgi:hypothetical protein